MTSLLLAVVVAQAAQTPLTVANTRRTGATAAEGLAMASRVGALLAEANVPVAMSAQAAAAKLTQLGTKDAAICQGKKACELELARQLDVKVLVTVSLARLGADLGVGVEALRLDDGAVLATDSLLLVGTTRLEAERLAPFVGRLKEALGLKAPAPTPEKPVVLTPRAQEPPAVKPVPLPPAQAEERHVAGISLVAGAGACAVAAIVLGLLAADANAQRTRVEGGAWASSYDGAVAWTNRTNGLLTATVATGSAAIALGAVGAIAW